MKPFLGLVREGGVSGHQFLYCAVSMRNLQRAQFRQLHTNKCHFTQASANSTEFIRSNSAFGTKPWNEAASLMIVAPMNNSEPFSIGYLMVERSRTGRVMPGYFVFPGGNVDTVDSHHNWIELFKRIQNLDISQERILQDSANIPEIYRSTKKDKDELIPKEKILRITAIRETFEEVGILLCKPKKVDSLNLIDGKMYYEYDQLQDKNEVKQWQKRVRKNSKEFIELCKQLDCVPDIHAIHDWNNWLTPTTFKPKSRFDTMFYMTILPKMPRVVIDGNEAVSAQWTSPSSILSDFVKGHIRLMPPQVYELSRLQKIKNTKDLSHRIGLRKTLGIERYFPVIKSVTDGSLFLLPGDDLYPETPDYIGTDPDTTQEISKSISELKKTSKNVHRGLIRKGGVFSLDDINVTRFGHVY